MERRYAELRAVLIAEIEAEVAATADATGRTALDRRVLDAIAAVPRHEFVPERVRALAYGNHPLPIGEGQTISQPYIVALMTDLLEPRPDHVVLEVGTGSGYQAAVLARLVRHVYSVEVLPALAEHASATLARLGIANVSVRTGDGAQGWAEHAPYDGIIVTAAGAELPRMLVDQLKPKGRLVMPVGRGGYQDLVLATKAVDGTMATREVLSVAFVPLV
jgi:protein-L-isoaspartate(D-aspartate) O-methyltransferase